MKKDLRDKATRRFATHEPGRALTVPTINVNQFANMIMSNLEDKIFKLVESRKMESLIGMRHELSSQASEMVDRKLTGLIEKLRSLRRRFSEGDVINVIEIPDRRSS